MIAQDVNDSNGPVLVLFRNDLRLSDNRALASAAATGRPVIAAFIFDEVSPFVRPRGAARRWWLHHSLAALSRRLESLGTRLILRCGAMGSVVDALITETGADTVFWNRRYDPSEIAVDTLMKANLRGRGIAAESFDGHLLHEPSLLRTGTGGPYKVYTPFWRALTDGPEPRDPIDAPKALRAPAALPASEMLEDWALLPKKPDWSAGLRAAWMPGEEGAEERLEEFLGATIRGYDGNRDIPGIDGTSRLSPYLANGEITPFRILATLRKHDSSSDTEKFRKEIGWREFSYHLLFHNAALASRNFNGRFDGFPWRPDEKALRRWTRGATGYPIVDAGMRELWQTGWMHNRVRMIAASFLIKHLLQDWRAGEQWFWDTLVDADPASNPASWQWVAGSGADAAPYFRIFNPVLQGEKFDPDGRYVRRYVPELAGVSDRDVHQPWKASEKTLSAAGVKLGTTYHVPLVEHASARHRALAAYKEIRGTE